MAHSEPSRGERGTIEHQRIIDAIATLGLDPADVMSVHVDGNHVGAVMFDRDENGKRWVVEPLVYAKRLVVLSTDLGHGEICEKCGVL